VVTVTTAITAAFAKVVVALAVAFNLGALFTDTQWSDIQSFLNFVVLLILYARQTRQPERAGRATVDTLTTELNGHVTGEQPTELRGLLMETILDAMEARRKTDPLRRTQGR
jgi:hypothetical protein